MVTADQEYQVKTFAAKEYIKLIAERIRIMDLKQQGEPGNWGYVGDINHVIEDLKEIDGFLSN